MLYLFGSILAILGINYKVIEEKVEAKMDSWTIYDALFLQYGKRWNVDPQWLKAIALNESNLGKAKSVQVGIQNPKDIENSKSSDGKSWGLMQVTLTTAKEMDSMATHEKLNNIEYSINLGARYVSKLKTYFSTADLRYIEWVIKSYNQGPGNTNKERTGVIKKGYADEYWLRFQNNLKRVRG